MKKNSVNSFGFVSKDLKKAKDLISTNLKNVDIVYELVDARAPRSTKNFYIEKVIAKKARIIILTRADLADYIKTKLWIENFYKDGLLAFGVNCKNSKNLNIILKASRSLLSRMYIERGRKNFIAKKFRAMVVGVPNIGKSTLINSLASKKKAKVGNFPGITLGKQWVSIDENIDLLDTPGSLSFEDKLEEDKNVLRLIGCVKDGVYDEEELALFLLSFLKKNYKKNFEKVFSKKLNLSEIDCVEVLRLFARGRLFLKKGGEEDIKRAAMFLIDRFKGAKLGRISLQVP